MTIERDVCVLAKRRPNIKDPQKTRSYPELILLTN